MKILENEDFTRKTPTFTMTLTTHKKSNTVAILFKDCEKNFVQKDVDLE